MERRTLDRETALGLADGRVFTGRQAVAAGLIDAIGGEVEARRWLAQAHGVSESVPVTDVMSGQGRSAGDHRRDARTRAAGANALT